MRARLLTGCLVLAELALAARAVATSLPSYGVDPSTVTIAGISSGGFMAVQMDIAFSSHFHGVAIFAGGPYDCAQDNVATALETCSSGVGIDVQALASDTAAQVTAGTIDATTNLAGQPIYLFSGLDDVTIHQPVMDALEQYYETYVAAADITYDNSTAAAHGWISPDGPNGCDTSFSPFINNCNIDSEQTFLTLFYGSLAAKNTGTLGGTFLQFDQTPFCSGGSCSAISLDDTGWLYVPQSCAGGQPCRLVMALHGCLQSQSVIGEDFVKGSGLAEWADTNSILVLYPQTVASVALVNDESCWDFWGYTGADYALQSGPQMQALMAMVNQITAPVAASGTTSGGSSSSSTTGGTASGATSGTTAAASGTTGALTSTSTSGAAAASSTSSATSTGASGTSAGASSGTTTSATSLGSTTGTASGAGTTTGAATASTSSGSSSGGGCATGSGAASWLVWLAVGAALRRRARR